MAFISINPEEARKYVSSVSEYASLISKEGKKFMTKVKEITIRFPQWKLPQNRPVSLLMFMCRIQVNLQH